MKIFFKSLAPIKKEVSKLRKTYNSIFGNKINLQIAQDLTANMYGWQHFNEMSHAHGEMLSMGDLNLLDYNQLRENDIHFSDIIDNESKNRLEIKKREVLLNYLSKSEHDSNKGNKFLIEFLTKKSMLNNLFGKDKDVSIFDINQSSWRYHTAILGDNQEQLSKIYSSVPILHAIDRGGFFVLRESTAIQAIKNIADSLPEDQQDRIHIIDLNTSFKSSRYNKSIDLKKDEDINTIFSFITSMISENYAGADGMWVERAISLLRCSKLLLNEKYGLKKGALNNINLTKLLTLDEILKIIVELGDTKATSSAKGFLVGIPGFDFDDYLKGKEIRSTAYEQMGYLIMQFSTMLAHIDLYHHNKVESINLTEKLHSNDIIFIVYNKGIENNKKLKGILSLFRGSIAPVLGNGIEKRNKNIVPSRIRSNRFKPIILDCADEYLLKGFSVVMAQMRGLGWAGFVHFKIPLRAKGLIPEEYCSLIANTLTKILLSAQNIDNKEIIDIGFSQDSNIELPRKEINNGIPIYLKPQTIHHEEEKLVSLKL